DPLRRGPGPRPDARALGEPARGVHRHGAVRRARGPAGRHARAPGPTPLAGHVTSVDVLQKLLLGPRADAVLAAGSASVGALVVRAADVTDLTTPTALLDAHGLRGRVDDRTTVHVVRFPVVPLMRLGRPPVDGPGASHP